MSWIKDARNAKGMSQAALARAIGVSQTVVSLLETNEDIEAKGELLMAINNVLTPPVQGKAGKTTQNQRVLAWMREKGSISQRDAVQFGCYRLSARIHDLRAAGHKITAENKGYSSALGYGHYAVYRLNEG